MRLNSWFKQADTCRRGKFQSSHWRSIERNDCNSCKRVAFKYGAITDRFKSDCGCIADWVPVPVVQRPVTGTSPAFRPQRHNKRSTETRNNGVTLSLSLSVSHYLFVCPSVFCLFALCLFFFIFFWKWRRQRRERRRMSGAASATAAVATAIRLLTSLSLC